MYIIKLSLTFEFYAYIWKLKKISLIQFSPLLTQKQRKKKITGKNIIIYEPKSV